MKVLITGSNGFIGKNLVAQLSERDDIDILHYTRRDKLSRLFELMSDVDFVFHLAGVNRPQNNEEFQTVNTDLTQAVCDAIVGSGKNIPVLYTSSTQAVFDNPYGGSKLGAEEVLQKFSREQGVAVYLFRLSNVFGKWAKPNYNSVVATFCHNVARDLPIQINDSSAEITLVYIDDVISKFISVMDENNTDCSFVIVEPQYDLTIGTLAELLESFRDSRNTLLTDEVGTGVVRALYSTYVSYLPPDAFTYAVPKYSDERGVFVEMLKTKKSGQFSFFTAHPGVTRGGHYHHTKTEKFLVIKGQAVFRFRHIVTDEYYEYSTSSDSPEIVETVPGWTHDITNAGNDEMIVMLWANEVFDREKPDTYAMPVCVQA